MFIIKSFKDDTEFILNILQKKKLSEYHDSVLIETFTIGIE